jgi:hypothetical protein
MPTKLGEVLESQLGLIESAILPLAKIKTRRVGTPLSRGPSHRTGLVGLTSGSSGWYL